MVIFYILFIIPMVIQHITIKGININYEKRNKIALGIFFSLLTVMIMLRHNSVGSDTQNYIYFFEKCSALDWDRLRRETVEVGYLYFNKGVSLVTHNTQMFLAILAITISGLIYPTYKRLCIDTSLTIAIFAVMSTFVMMFSGMRQMLAIGIGFVAYDFARNKRIVPFIAAVIIATLFHASAFMLILMYPAYHARVTKNWLYLIIPLLILIFIFNEPIFIVLSLVIEQYTRFDASITETDAYMMLILFSAFTVFAFIIPDESKLDDETIGLRNFLLIALVVQMFAPLHTLAMRMSYYYIIFIPLLLPKIIEYRSKKWSQIAIMGRRIMILFFLLYFFMNASRGGNLHVFPYHFFWEDIGWL